MNAMTEFTEQPAPEDLSRALLLNPERVNALIGFAKLMAESLVTVPKHLQGKPADCMAVAMQAARWGMNPFAVAQKTHVVNGALGYEAQLVNAVIQASGAIVGHFHYDYRGDGPKLEVRVGARLPGDTDPTWGEWLGVNDVKTKNSPLWATNPKQQLGYLQVKNWARLYAPGAILGVYSTDELEELAPPRRQGPQRASATAARQAGAMDAAGKPATPLVDEVPEHERGGGTATSNADPKTGETTPPPAAAKPATSGSAGGGISGNQVAYLRNKLKHSGITEQTICDRFQVASIDLLTSEAFDTVKAELIAQS